MPQSHLQNGNNNETYWIWLLWELNETIHVKDLEEKLAHGRRGQNYKCLHFSGPHGTGPTEKSLQGFECGDVKICTKILQKAWIGLPY